MQKRFVIITILLFLLASHAIEANVRLPNIFSEDMVIQRDRPVKIWGWADKNESITISFNGQVKKTKADKKGCWITELRAVGHGGPYIMQIEGEKNMVTFHNILVGEVWLASGQSNMEWVVHNTKDAETEISNASYPKIRSFNLVKNMSMQPLDDVEGKWDICSPRTVANFSAVAYFFAQKLNQELNIPIGIIHSSWGGTGVETWTSSEAANRLPDNLKDQTMIPKVNAQNVAENEKEKNRQNYIEALSRDIGLVRNWNDPSTDASSWDKMRLPQFLEKKLGNTDGTIWFRYDITLPSDVVERSAVIHLGQIDDWDVTWINGTKVGETNDYMALRQYHIPVGALKEGKNSIVVKVRDMSGPGGICGRSENMYLQISENKYPIHGDWLFKESATDRLFNYVQFTPNTYYSLLYNAMINPIVKYAIKGVIWYQGENNASQAYKYRSLFPALINDWRSKWGYEFPFYWVQLANFMSKDGMPCESEWAELREAQTMTLSLPKTGQAVITDIGDAIDIHPRNKQDVGLRLALVALNKDYGKSDVVYSGPTYRFMKVDGNKVIIEYENAENGLLVKDKYGYVEGFTIAGDDKQFYWAKAYIDENKVVVSSCDVSNPVAVRYSWSNNPDVNLYNKEGLPAVPFRTDDWKGITQRERE